MGVGGFIYFFLYPASSVLVHYFEEFTQLYHQLILSEHDYSLSKVVLYHQPLIFDRHVSMSNSFGKLPAYLVVASFLLKASLLLHALEHESLPFAISMHKFVGTSCRWFYENYFSCIFLWFYLLLSSLFTLNIPLSVGPINYKWCSFHNVSVHPHLLGK